MWVSTNLGRDGRSEKHDLVSHALETAQLGLVSLHAAAPPALDVLGESGAHLLEEGDRARGEAL